MEAAFKRPPTSGRASTMRKSVILRSTASVLAVVTPVKPAPRITTLVLCTSFAANDPRGHARSQIKICILVEMLSV